MIALLLSHHRIYVPLMSACLASISVSGTADLLDDRYFYFKDGCVYCTCGLARQGVAEFLRQHAEETEPE